ncbi:MAG: HmuY family protein [Longimicrobiales bacterium]|nr:HmuY family protein [Longimicrobiales bacterium]
MTSETTNDTDIWFRGKISKSAISIVLLLSLVAGLFVARSLRNPEIPWFPVSELKTSDVGSETVGPLQYTVDARSEQPVFFDFSSGSVVQNPSVEGWDLEISRFNIRSNGGEGFTGNGGILDLGVVAFDSLRSVPEVGYVQNSKEKDIANLATDHWYDYSWINHLLTPKPKLFAVRTADSRYAFLEFVSYYCAGARAGCLTFRYFYQGDGSSAF